MNLDKVVGKSRDATGQHPCSYNHTNMIAHETVGCDVSSPAKERQHMHGHQQQLMQQRHVDASAPGFLTERACQTVKVKEGASSGGAVEDDGSVGDDHHWSGTTMSVNDRDNAKNPKIAVTPMPSARSNLTPELMEMEEDSHQPQCNADDKPSDSIECWERLVVDSSSVADPSTSSSLSSSVRVAAVPGKKTGDCSLGTQAWMKKRHDVFEEGQHVFVIIGKTEYPAVIVSVGSQMAWIRWSTTGSLEEVEVEQLRPMFEEINGDIFSSSYSVRKRQATNRYAPVLQKMPSKQIRRSDSTRDSVGVAVSSRKRIETDRFYSPDLPSTMNNYVHHAPTSNAPSTLGARKRARVDSDLIIESPGPGWKPKSVLGSDGMERTRWISKTDFGEEATSLVEAGWRSSISWISPSGIRFCCLKRAFRFERMKRQSNGDEEKAWVLYTRKRVIRKSESKSKAQGTVEPPMKVGKKLHAAESSDDPSSKQKCQHRAKKGRSMATTPASLEMQSQPSKLSDQDESDYKSLWKYYMAPVVRENEELSSGMVIRSKHAKCSLLRARGPSFRKALHKRLLCLEKKGDKSGILEMLREMKGFDMSMQSGDGPPHLVAKVIGSMEVDEVEVLDSLAISEMKSPDETTKNVDGLMDLRSSYDLSEEHVSENSHIVGRKPTAMQQDDRREPLKSNLPFEPNLLRAPTAPNPDEVIDLSQDTRVDFSSSCTQSDNIVSDNPKVGVPKSAAECTYQEQYAGKSTPLKSNSPTAQCDNASAKHTASQGVSNSEIINLYEDDVEGSAQYGDVIDLLDDEDTDEVIMID